MKRLSLLLTVLLTVVCMSYAQDINSYVGFYSGTLHDIEMNHNQGYPDENTTFEIQSDGEHLFLDGEFGPVGQMPGKISIHFQIEIKDGVIEPASGVTSAGRLYFNWGGSTDLKLEDIVGTINSDNKLDFTLNVHGSFLGISVFPAQVSFTSDSYIKK